VSTQAFPYGPHQLTVGFKQLTAPCNFNVTVTAAMSRPGSISFAGSVPLNSEVTQYVSKGGFAMEYLADVPQGGFVTSPDAEKIIANFFTNRTLETPPRFPGLARAEFNDTAIEQQYDNVGAVSQYYSPISPSGDPVGDDGCCESRYVAFNAALDTSLPLCTFQWNQPANSLNPPWTFGSTAQIKFSCAEGGFPDLIAYLTVVKVSDGTIQPVIDKSGPVGNKFSSGQAGNNFTFNLDTGQLSVQPGTSEFFQLIVSSNKFAPVDGIPALTDPAKIVTVVRAP